MKTKIALSTVALTLLAGCGGGTPKSEQAPTGTTSIKPASPFVDRLRTLDEFDRGLALRRAIQDSGASCKKVDRSGYQEDYKNLSMWVVRCPDKDWALFIAPDGAVQVRPCADAEQLKLPACRFQGEAKS